MLNNYLINLTNVFMYKVLKPNSLFVIAVQITALLLSGCESMTGKFAPHKKVNLTPFATNTAAMVNTIDYGLERDLALHTRWYFQEAQNDRDFRELLQLQNQLNKIFRGIVAYSVEIVALSKSNKTESEKALALAEYLNGLEKFILGYYIDKEILTEEQYEEALGKIESKAEFLDALATAQPFIDYVANYSRVLTNRLLKLELAIEIKIEDSIDNDHRTLIDFYNMLNERRDLVMTSLNMINQYYQGNEKALSQLEQSGNLSKLGFLSIKVNAANVADIETRLFEKFSQLQKQFAELQPDYDLYLEKHSELDKLIKIHNEEVRQSIDIILIWTEAHRKMSSGITEPAEWFDITDPAGQFFDLTKTVIKQSL